MDSNRHRYVHVKRYVIEASQCNQGVLHKRAAECRDARKKNVTLLDTHILNKNTESYTRIMKKSIKV